MIYVALICLAFLVGYCLWRIHNLDRHAFYCIDELADRSQDSIDLHILAQKQLNTLSEMIQVLSEHGDRMDDLTQGDDECVN